MQHLFIIYADLECLLTKMSICHDDPERSSTTKKMNIHLMCTHCSFDATRNKLNCYRSKDFVWEDFANT